MEILQEDGILIKKLCQSGMVHEGCCTNFPIGVGNLKALTHWQSAKENLQDAYNCPATMQRYRPHSACSSGGPCAQSGDQAKKASISSWDFIWNFHSLFQCAQDNTPQSPAQMLQMMSCSAVVRRQSYLPSHSLINNLIACNKSCYCSIINRKLNNK